MSRVTLYLCARHDRRMEWMQEFIEGNRALIDSFSRKDCTVTLKNGDQRIWRMLDDSIRSMRCDDLKIDPDMERGRLDDRQREMLLVARTLVRPKFTGAPVITVSVAGCDLEGNPVTPWVTATRRGVLGNAEAPDITVDVDTVVSGFVCSDGSRCFFAHPTILVPKGSIRLNHNTGKKPSAD